MTAITILTVLVEEGTGYSVVAATAELAAMFVSSASSSFGLEALTTLTRRVVKECRANPANPTTVRTTRMVTMRPVLELVIAAR